MRVAQLVQEQEEQVRERAAQEEAARMAVMTERLRIARDLHDLLGHNLSLITLKSELARRLAGTSSEQLASEIGDIEQVARTTLQEVREAVGNYRQPTLSNELHAAQEILAAAGITCHYEGDGSNGSHGSHGNDIETLPTAIEAVLAWAMREGVTNVIRHSRAHSCTIRVTRGMQTAQVEIIDDGVGIVLAPVAQPASAASTNGASSHHLGNGLHGLAERVAALGGHFAAGPTLIAVSASPSPCHWPKKWEQGQMNHDDLPLNHDDLPMIYGDLPLNHGDLPMIYGDLPLNYGDLPMIYGDLPMIYGDLPMIYGDLPMIYGDLPMIYGDLPMIYGD
ncbi:MAG TPA: sensor histidine kinase, partial [Ktedonobacteraceae bacterium]|nr:sensor histidine kinase [Ktedonobacteraceae bacterium]